MTIKIKYAFSFFLPFWLASCGLSPSAQTTLTIYDDKKIEDFKRCIDKFESNFDVKCSSMPEFFKTYIGVRSGQKVTMIEQIWFEYNAQKKHSFRLVEKMVDNGADILKISRSVIDLGSIDDYKSLVKIGGGPNSLVGTGLLNGSIMHSTIELWQTEKVNYLLSQKPDLEQRNDDGETALLVARRSPLEVSRIEKMKILIDHGADISVLDRSSKGMCDFIVHERDLVQEKFLPEIEEFEHFLKSKGLVCN